MKSAARQIAEFMSERNKNLGPSDETFVNPGNGKVEANFSMVPTALLNQLTKDFIGPSSLKPCPFCAVEPKVKTTGFGTSGEIIEIRCRKCGIHMKGTKPTAKRKWNHRA